MDFANDDLIWLCSPSFPGEFVWCEAYEDFALEGVVGDLDEVAQMVAQLFMAVVVETLYGSVLEGAVHVLDLPIGPWMIDLREAVLDSIFTASHVEHMGRVLGGWSVGVSRRISKLDVVVGEHRVDFVGHNPDHSATDLHCLHFATVFWLIP